MGLDLAAGGAAHEGGDGVGDGGAFVEDPADLLGDRHLDPVLAASSSTPFVDFTPSATMFISDTIWSMVLPCPSPYPTMWLRLLSLMQVAMRSPMPASPAKVSG